MKTLKALQARRTSIEKINKVARAMEAIASTRLQRYEAAVFRFRAFIQAQREITQNLALCLKKINSPWVDEKREAKGALVIFISSDRGFCGGFNNQLLALIERAPDVPSFSFIGLGKKGARLLKRRNFNLIEQSGLPREDQLQDFIPRVTQKALSFYLQKNKKVFLVFNRFRKNLLGQPLFLQIFPLEIKSEERMSLDYLFEPESPQLLDRFLSLYAYAELQAAILESQAAEEMARMVAMTEARRNAEDLIKDLTLQYHKARQARITRELIEIVSAT